MDQKEFSRIIEGLKNNKLTNLDLSRKFLDHAQVKTLAAVLKENTSLQTLDLSWSGIGDAEVEALAEALKGNTSLRNLKLSANRIGVVGAKALAELLKKNKSLHTLDLCGNEIGDAGIKFLAEALKVNTELHVLDLVYIGIGVDGVEALAEALKANTTLYILKIAADELKDAGAQHFIAALYQNKSIIEFSFSGLEENDSRPIIDQINEIIKRNRALLKADCDKIINGVEFDLKRKAQVLDQCITALEHLMFMGDPGRSFSLNEATMKQAVTEFRMRNYKAYVAGFSLSEEMMKQVITKLRTELKPYYLNALKDHTHLPVELRPTIIRYLENFEEFNGSVFQALSLDIKADAKQADAKQNANTVRTSPRSAVEVRASVRAAAGAGAGSVTVAASQPDNCFWWSSAIWHADTVLRTIAEAVSTQAPLTAGGGRPAAAAAAGMISKSPLHVGFCFAPPTTGQASVQQPLVFEGSLEVARSATAGMSASVVSHTEPLTVDNRQPAAAAAASSIAVGGKRRHEAVSPQSLLAVDDRRPAAATGAGAEAEVVSYARVRLSISNAPAAAQAATVAPLASGSSLGAAASSTAINPSAISEAEVSGSDIAFAVHHSNNVEEQKAKRQKSQTR